MKRESRGDCRLYCRLLLALAVLGASFGYAGERAAPATRPAPATRAADRFLEGLGIEYRLEVRPQPRPLRLHHLRIDLASAKIELAAALSADPDGDGPATAALESPLSLASRYKAVVLVNANPWGAIPDAAGKLNTSWRRGQHVRIGGLAASAGRLRSKPAERYCGFWTDRAGKAHVGNPPDTAAVVEGLAGFAQILRDGKVLHKPGGAIHPRTALGLDASGRWLHLLVVDGRQKGYSEGMSYYELAVAMRDLGCTDAANLDGGGSSIMILGDAGGKHRVVNDPSGKRNGVSVPRPIPTALVIRAK